MAKLLIILTILGLSQLAMANDNVLVDDFGKKYTVDHQAYGQPKLYQDLTDAECQQYGGEVIGDVCLVD